MTTDRTRELFEAYGADPARWPKEEASMAAKKGVSAGSGAGELDEARVDAARLDSLLNLYTVSPAEMPLRANVLAVRDSAVDVRDVTRINPPEQRRRRFWDLSGGLAVVLRGAFPQLFGLALASMLGFMVGATDMLPIHDHGISVDASGLVLGEDGLGSFDS